MTLKVTDIEDGNKYILLEGRFDYNSHSDIKNFLDSIDRTVNVIIDLSRTTYMDSSALGMLLNIKGKANRVTLERPNGTVAEMLEISQFHKLFEVIL